MIYGGTSLETLLPRGVRRAEAGGGGGSGRWCLGAPWPCMGTWRAGPCEDMLLGMRHGGRMLFSTCNVPSGSQLCLWEQLHCKSSEEPSPPPPNPPFALFYLPERNLRDFFSCLHCTSAWGSSSLLPAGIIPVLHGAQGQSSDRRCFSFSGHEDKPAAVDVPIISGVTFWGL